MNSINRKKALILLSMVALAAIISGVVLNAYSADNVAEDSNGYAERINERMMAGPFGWSRGPMRGQWRHRFVEVSEEFEENVINIASSDQDVQNLLDDGYNITRVRPIIQAMVEADGNVATKATSTVVMLEKDATSHASVWVNLEEAKVTKIVILTRTVLEKA